MGRDSLLNSTFSELPFRRTIDWFTVVISIDVSRRGFVPSEYGEVRNLQKPTTQK